MEKEKLIETAQKMAEIISKLEKMGKKVEEIIRLKDKSITLKKREGYYPEIEERDYGNFKVRIRPHEINIFIKKDNYLVMIYEGEISLRSLYKLMKHKDEVIPVLEKELSKEDEELDKTIDELKRAIATLELAGFEVK